VSVFLARHVLTPTDLERYNANYVGGDINGGVQDPLAALHTSHVPPSTPIPPLQKISLSARHQRHPVVVFTGCVVTSRHRQPYANGGMHIHYEKGALKSMQYAIAMV